MNDILAKPAAIAKPALLSSGSMVSGSFLSVAGALKHLPLQGAFMRRASETSNLPAVKASCDG